MQVCGILVGPRVDEIPDNVFHTSSRINSTWGGSLVDMVRATKYLEIIDEENLVQNAATVGAYLRDQLRELATTHSDHHITNVRGLVSSVHLICHQKKNETLFSHVRMRINFCLLEVGTDLSDFVRHSILAKKKSTSVWGSLRNRSLVDGDVVS